MRKVNISILLILTLIVLGSCLKEAGFVFPDYALDFHPRTCEKIYTVPLICKTKGVKQGKKKEGPIRPLKKQDKVPAQRFGFCLITGGKNLRTENLYIPNHFDMPIGGSFYLLKEIDKGLAPHNKELEEALKRDEAEHFRTSLIHWEYRTSGVKSFKIIALSPLFGQKAKTSLNKYFSIEEFAPRQIISYENNHLVWGYKDREEVKTIDQWLSFKPTAPPAVCFRLKARPKEAPTTVSFVIILETTDGKVLKDTMQVDLQ